MEERKEKEKRLVDVEDNDRLSSALPVPPIFAVSPVSLFLVFGWLCNLFFFPLLDHLTGDNSS